MIEENKPDVFYTDYTNERFVFSLQYPSELTMCQPPENGGGVHLYNDDFEMTASGVHTNVVNFDETIEEYLQGGEEIAYQRLEKDWYVLS